MAGVAAGGCAVLLLFAVFLIPCLVAALAVFMDGFSMVDHLLGKFLFFRQALQSFFLSFGHFPRNLVAGDAAVHGVAFFQALDRFGVFVMMAVTTSNGIIRIVFSMGEYRDALLVAVVCGIFHLDDVRAGTGEQSSSHKDRCKRGNRQNFDHLTFFHGFVKPPFQSGVSSKTGVFPAFGASKNNQIHPT